MSEALLNNAQRLSKSFAQRSAEFERARRLPEDVSDAMAKAGIYRMFVPQSLGCLLYTSPSPRDKCRSRMPSSA